MRQAIGLLALLWVNLLAPVSSQQCFHASDEYEDEDLFVVCQSEKNLNNVNNCSDWCAGAAPEYFVEKSDQGQIHVTLDPSPRLCNHTAFALRLVVARVSQDACVPSMDQRLFHEHSELVAVVQYEPEPCSDSSKRKSKNSVVFNHVFAGCYTLVYKPLIRDNTQQPCYSGPFYVTSQYSFKPIGEPVWKISGTLHRSLSVQFFWSGQDQFKSFLECTEIYLEDSKTEDEITSCTLDNLNRGLQVNGDKCRCEWHIINQSSVMECIFNDLESGYYMVQVKAYDVRCRADTIWTMDSNTWPHCYWSANLSFTSNEYGTDVVKVPYDESLLTWLLLAFLFIVPLAAAILVMIFCRHKGTQHYGLVNSHPAQIVKITKEESKVKVLLLYSRDCKPFMEAMNVLRTLLNETGQLEVHDALDPDQFEKVAINPNTWGLDLISNPSSKVILVASPCSVALYRGLIASSPVSHAEHRAFDSVFVSTLNHLTHQIQPYNKIFIIRLDCEEVQNLSFDHLSQSRIFTLPQSTQPLIRQLLQIHEGCKILIESKCNTEELMRQLQDAIEAYSAYLKDNPEYLKSFLEENGRIIR